MKWALNLLHSQNHILTQLTSYHTSAKSHIPNTYNTITCLIHFCFYLFYYYLHIVKWLLLAFCLRFTLIALMSLFLSPVSTFYLNWLVSSVFFQYFFFLIWYLLDYLCIWLDRRVSSRCVSLYVCNFPLHFSSSISSSLSLSFSLSLLLVHFLQYFVCNKNLIATTTTATTLHSAHTHTHTLLYTIYTNVPAAPPIPPRPRPRSRIDDVTATGGGVSGRGGPQRGGSFEFLGARMASFITTICM